MSSVGKQASSNQSTETSANGRRHKSDNAVQENTDREQSGAVALTRPGLYPDQRNEPDEQRDDGGHDGQRPCPPDREAQRAWHDDRQDQEKIHARSPSLGSGAHNGPARRASGMHRCRSRESTIPDGRWCCRLRRTTLLSLAAASRCSRRGDGGSRVSWDQRDSGRAAHPHPARSSTRAPPPETTKQHPNHSRSAAHGRQRERAHEILGFPHAHYPPATFSIAEQVFAPLGRARWQVLREPPGSRG